jgi:hypothetical protein
VAYRCLPKIILKWKPTGTRIRGRPGKRWIADIEKGTQIVGRRRWIKQCEVRAGWKIITEKVKPIVGFKGKR